MKTIPHAIKSTTKVLIAVARFEFTPSIPTFARIEVKAAKTAEPIAKIIHIAKNLILFFYKINYFQKYFKRTAAKKFCGK